MTESDVAREFRKLRGLVDLLEATMDSINKKALLAKIRKASAALKIGPKQITPGRPRRAPVIDWCDLVVIANLADFGGSIRKAVKACCEAGLLPRTSTQDAHRVRIESRIKEIRAAAKSSNVVAFRK